MDKGTKPQVTTWGERTNLTVGGGIGPKQGFNEADVRYVSGEIGDVLCEIGSQFLMHDRFKGGRNVYRILCMGTFLHTTTFLV